MLKHCLKVVRCYINTKQKCHLYLSASSCFPYIKASSSYAKFAIIKKKRQRDISYKIMQQQKFACIDQQQIYKINKLQLNNNKQISKLLPDFIRTKIERDEPLKMWTESDLSVCRYFVQISRVLCVNIQPVNNSGEFWHEFWHEAVLTL
ncbi:Hypothetical_protein [Hexamita inflata]|uniref:Hypothetical_protein n=1 Tax=Hexamita inflata TaxID=28002 RepID=A0AA86U3J6_9EUKA|nr:Hypothetical protein HINF_LOCUS24332 [Hexamita inflata]